MKRWLALLGTSLLLAASHSSASDCKVATTISEAIDAQHEFVLRGKVLRVREPLENSGIVPVMFSLIRAYRGAPPQIINVHFNPANDPRKLSFHKGDVFLLSTRPGGAGPAASDAEGYSIGDVCTLRQLVGVSR